MKSRHANKVKKIDDEIIPDRTHEKKQYAQHIERTNQRKQVKAQLEHQQPQKQYRFHRQLSVFCGNQLNQPRSHSEERTSEIMPRQRH